MKWFLFLLIVFLSCIQDKKSPLEPVEFDSSIVSKKQDTVKVSESHRSETKENSPLDIFFSKNISQSSLKFYKIDPVFSGDDLLQDDITRGTKPGIRLISDTIRIGQVLIVQQSNPEEGSLLSFKINGKKFHKEIGR